MLTYPQMRLGLLFFTLFVHAWRIPVWETAPVTVCFFEERILVFVVRPVDVVNMFVQFVHAAIRDCSSQCCKSSYAPAFRLRPLFRPH